MDLIVLNNIYRFLSYPDKPSYDAPYLDVKNVLKYSKDIEDFCKSRDIQYYCLSLETYNLIRGV
jgi:hypothetical protein